MESNALSEWAGGQRVRIEAPGAWYDGLTGTVVGPWEDGAGQVRFTIETDDPFEPRAAVWPSELRSS